LSSLSSSLTRLITTRLAKSVLSNTAPAPRTAEP
jgi:hypothetical protein